MSSFEEYKQEMIDDIQETVAEANCQPVIFAGSGLSIRYFGGPNWDELLKELVERCPILEEEYGYYRQTRNPKEMGVLLSQKYAQWAWSDYSEYTGEEEAELPEWDEEVFDHTNRRDTFLKSKIAEYFREITPKSVEELDEDVVDGNLSLDVAKTEIELLREIQPHAVVTTNYDRFFEAIFNKRVSDENLFDKEFGKTTSAEDAEGDDVENPSYRVVIGEQVLKTRYRNIGEILHIHGSVSDPTSLILTEGDYKEFNKRRRYLISKMLAYFAEHPLLIVGYRPNDPNVQQVFSWADKVLSDEESITDDIFFLRYKEDVEQMDEYPTEYDIRLDEGGHLRVKGIVANKFDWVFEAFAESGELEVDPRYLRNLLSQTYEVVTSQKPGTEVVDVERLEEVATDKDELRTVLGISPESSLPPIQFDHTYRPSEAADEVGLDSYRALNRDIISKIENDTGVDIKSFNNRYHIALSGEQVTPRRYSEEAIELFEKVKNGEDYHLAIPRERIPE